MATAFYGTMTIQNTDGTVTADRFNSTDVTLAYVTWQSAGSDVTFTVPKNGYIKDIVLNITSAGDTKYFKMYINQRDTNIYWVQSANFPTVDNRFLNLVPVPVSAGDRIQIQAIT